MEAGLRPFDPGRDPPRVAEEGRDEGLKGDLRSFDPALEPEADLTPGERLLDLPRSALGQSLERWPVPPQVQQRGADLQSADAWPDSPQYQQASVGTSLGK